MSRPVCILVAVLFAFHSSQAQIPHTLSYQGVLTDTSGAPKPDGTYNFTFRLYTTASGGNALWSETKTATVKKGLFSTILGSVTPIPDSVTFDRQYWLGVQVASDPELSPRMQLASVGSSMNSLRADVAQSVPDGSITAVKIASGQVVKSINNVRDNLTMRGANGASITTSGDTITITASGGGGGGIGTIQNTNNTLTILNPGGPTATVNVKVPLSLSGAGAYNAPGAARFDLFNTTAGNGYLQHVTDNGSWQIASINGAATRIMIDPSGNVGIGTTTPGGKLQVNGDNGYGVVAYSTDAIALYGRSDVYGVNGITDGSNAAGVFGTSTASSSRGVLGISGGSGSPGVQGITTGANAAGVYGFNDAANGVGVQGSGGGTSNSGVLGQSASGVGVWGSSNSWRGVYGQSNSNAGVVGVSQSFDGVFGESHSNSSAGVSGHNTAGGFAGYFVGNVVVTGTLSKGAGAFKIDHPLDPENKYLYHSFVESPDMKNIYDGLITTDERGVAVIALPDWFEALNKDFRYQLTIIGDEFAQARISQRISGNRFSIKTDKPNIEVSWQVTGIRKDAYAEKNRIPIEEMKIGNERGHYLHPEAFRQPKEKRIGWTKYLEATAKENEAQHPGLKEVHEMQPLRSPVNVPKE